MVYFVDFFLLLLLAPCWCSVMDSFPSDNLQMTSVKLNGQNYLAWSMAVEVWFSLMLKENRSISLLE